MKRKIKSLLILSALTFSNVLFSCGGGEQTSSSTSESISETVTSLEIAGATSVLKGKTIQLVSSVDDVTWSTSDEYIASVDENGVVTGVEAGEVVIKATYNQDETIYDEITITVYLYKAESINVTLSGEDVNAINETTYNVPLGKVFDVYVSVNEGFSIPDFSYEIQYPAGSEIDNVINVTPDENNVGHATIIAYYDIKNVTLVCKGNYSDLATGTLIKSVVFNVIDNNEENINQVNAYLDSYKSIEKDRLLSYKSNYSLKYEDSNSSNGVYEENVKSTYSKYLNSGYVSSTNDDNFMKNHYQGVNVIGVKSTYYSFDYDEDGKITNLYNNEAINEFNQNSYAYIMNPNNSSIFGVSGLLDSILNSTSDIYNNIISLGNIYAYANSEFEFIGDNIFIKSSFINLDTNLSYDIKLTITKDNDDITSLKYEQTIIGENINENNQVVGTYKYTFIEEYSDFVYGTLVKDSSENENYLDINSYYMTAYDLVELAGTQTDEYNYSDLNKYGADLVTTENGLTKYLLTTDKTLVLKVDNITPNNASTLIDRVSASSNDTDQIPNVSLTGSDVFSINAKKDDNSISLPGKATFTFKSTLGIEKQIIVEFVEAALKEVYVSHYFGSNDFGEIYIGEITNYFFITTNPDEDKYTFGIDIISGEEDGIELVKHEDGNMYSYPGFSYSIKGIKEGTYQFKIFVENYETVTSEETFTIKVLKKISAEEIKSNLIGKTYRNTTSTVTYELVFTSETVITYNYYAYGDIISKSIAYYIEDGLIMIDGTQNLGTDAYYSYVKGEKVIFANDFSSVTLYFEQYVPGVEPIKDANGEIKHSFFAVTFDEYIDKTNFETAVNGKTYRIEEFIYGLAKMCTLTLSFNNGKGTLIVKINETSEIVATITFDYSYDSSYQKVIMTNIVSSSKSWTINTSSSSSGDYNINMFILKVQVSYNGNSTQVEFDI